MFSPQRLRSNATDEFSPVRHILSAPDSFFEAFEDIISSISSSASAYLNDISSASQEQEEYEEHFVLGMTADDASTRICHMQMKFKEKFGKMPRGCYARNKAWLQEKLSADCCKTPKANTCSTRVSHVSTHESRQHLRKKYFEIFGKHPRGRYAKNIAWLTQKVNKEKSKLDQIDDEITSLTKKLQDAKKRRGDIVKENRRKRKLLL